MEEQIQEIFDRMTLKHALPVAKEMKTKLNEINHKQLEELIEHNIANISDAIRKSTTNNVTYTVYDTYVCNKSLYKLICDHLIGLGYGITEISKIDLDNKSSITIVISW